MFKLPEEYRDNNYPFDNRGGIFRIPPKGDYRALKVIATDGTSISPVWEHVSVSLDIARITSRTPNWYEMCYVKSLFWDDDDIVIQYHVPSRRAINIHPGCLHLWRCPHQDQLMPPDIFV